MCLYHIYIHKSYTSLRVPKPTAWGLSKNLSDPVQYHVGAPMGLTLFTTSPTHPHRVSTNTNLSDNGTSQLFIREIERATLRKESTATGVKCQVTTITSKSHHSEASRVCLRQIQPHQTQHSQSLGEKNRCTLSMM